MKLPAEQEAIRANCYHPSETFVEFPLEDVESSIPARFKKMVRRHADRIAVKTESSVTTYNQLDVMADQFARVLLKRQGAKPQLVALLLEKDVSQVAAMLGVMKAGKFFLILDPSFPKTRLTAMLKGSRAKLVVTNRQNASLADEIAAPDCQLMQWETVDGLISGDNLELPIAPKALAFINYTSGSTGEPKGLLRTHRMILHNIMLRTNFIHVCEHDRISLLSSGTSNAITNSLLALLNGAGLYSLQVKKEGVARMGRWLREEGITIAPMSSPLFRNLCETLKGNHNFPDLRVLRLRSESVFKSDIELYKQFLSPKCVFVTGLSSNETGPLSDYLIDHRTVATDGAVPVGYSAPGKQILLLNEDGETIGINEVGEIAVRSRYLSPGYLRNSRLAKSKFKRDPIESGSRIYLTGDMGLRLSDGCLIHKGRKDFRVKVRGYPVDLKEVEITLRTHPSMHDSVVTARTNKSGETDIIAYFVTASGQSPSVSELVRFLRQTLPDYMIPAAFVRLERMPLNPQNKIDRTALPLPADTRPNLDIPFMAPRYETERQVAELWAEVLGIDQVGIHDNFFELGGHSLAATRIVTRVIDRFRLNLPLQTLFDSPTVEAMAAAIKENQSGNPGLCELRSSYSDGAKHVHSVRSPGNFTPFPKTEVEGSVPERFEKLVRMYPDRIAVKTGQSVLTYSELNAMANRLAHAIVAKRGTKAEAIAILLEKGPRLMAAMLAVLKAGKFFVLLESSFPKARLARVLDDSQAALIIAERSHYEAMREANGTAFDLLEFGTIPADAADEKNLGLTISPHSLAAVVYTSGSTGDPKGVMRAHRNLLHQAMLFANAFRISENDRLLLTTSGTANALTIGFLALLTGAALLPFDVQSQGIRNLIRWIVEERITICWIGSPLFRNMCHTLAGKTIFSDVRILRLSSDVSFKSDIELYKQHFSPECQLINGLSNTEAGLICLYSVDADTELLGQDVPVGYPVEDKQVLLLDDSGKEVAFSEVGEIAIRSRYLSPGYWHRQELTATKFKPDPDGGDQSIYLSGDLAIRLADGCLIHKGRKDFRVKIRGYAVELAEIEKALISHASIRQAVVTARKKDASDAQLVAYYTRTELPTPTVSELRGFLKRKLPDFMIPATFVMVEALPLSQSGKIDRRALPDPQSVRPDLVTAYLAPRTEIEQKLVSIWENVLGVRPIGINDGFFDLGGDSLSATRLISHVLEHFQLEIALQSLFQSPTIADMAAVIALRQYEISGHDRPDYAAESSEFRELQRDILPLSFSQQRLWFLDQLDPGSVTYNLFSAYRLKGDLNVPALEQSFNEIVRRHDILRTVFKSEGGRPAQVVLPNLTIKIPVFDLRATVSDEDRGTEARRMFTEEAQRPFDLACGPLLRIKLLQLADDEYLLLRTMHHIVSDAWSAGVLSRELSELYGALSIGKPSPLAELVTQYADYAKWQRQSFQGQRLESQLSYWKKQLENVATLQLPTDRPRQGLHTPCGARRYFAFSRELSSELEKLSHRRGASLFMTLLAAFQTLLHRYSGQTDIVIGSPVAGRCRREFEELIGFFLNTLVLRVEFSGNPTFTELIGRVREICLGALSHQELPFEKLVEELHPERNLGRNPLFQVSFAFQNMPRALPHLSDIKVDEVEVDTGIARFDLHLFMEEIDGHLKGYFNYDTNLFNAETIERLVGHFQTLLEGIVANPERRISELPLLTAAEKHRLLVAWNDTATDYPKDQCVHQLFQAQAERTPDAIAVVFADQRLTYRELNQRANQLAHYLRKLGVGPEILVGICIKRSLELIVGLLAIHKAGGTYLPLDPSYPAGRLELMLADAQASVLLTQGGLFDEGQSRIADSERCWTIARGVPRVRMDRDWALIAKECDANPETYITADNIAYVIYTSGSTGQPKGVQITHKSLLNLIFWHRQSFSVTPIARATQLAGPGFDAAIWELWPYLTAGASIHIPDEMIRLHAATLRDWLVAQTITISFVPTALAESLLMLDWPKETALRILLTGGDALHVYPPETVPFLVYNNYGPTECTVVAASGRVLPNANPMHPPTIGRPIANAEIYILDANLNPVPIAVPGELYIGGIGCARDYLNDAELTAAKFIEHSFDGEPGRRLYKTGDLARYLPDGNIEFLGRLDHQVKIRGYRIELGEIEAVLSRHPGIQTAVVIARGHIPANIQLVAYVVLHQACAVKNSELRDFLKQQLPDYMIPSAFVFLDVLPLTPNGKVDRRALPVPVQNRAEMAERYQAPRTATEEKLVGIWTQVLGIDRVGIHDNFFELGGHSLLAVRLFVEIEKTIGWRLPLATIFQAPTIEQLAVILKQEEWSESQVDIWSNYPSPVVPFQPNGSKPPLFWFNWGPWDFRLPRYLGSDQPVYGLQHQSQDGSRAQYTSIEAMAAHYIKEIRAVQTKGPYFLGGLCIGGMVVFEIALQLQNQGEEVALLVLLDPTNPRSGKSSSLHNHIPSLSSRIMWFGNKVNRHLHELAPLGTQERLSYALLRVNDRFMGLREKINWMWRKVLLEAFNRPLPASLRARYIVSIYETAARAYVPRIYRGRAVLFKTQGRYHRAQLAWGDYVAEVLEIQELDTGHDKVFKEPYVQTFADRLKTALSAI